ncbi:hypothetical protein [Labilithrix luteola]|nr:hypothetical protein [Labilithrix luteola]
MGVFDSGEMTMSARDSWEVFDDERPFAGVIYGRQRVRTVVIGIGDGGLLVFSPGVPLAERLWSELEAWGRPRFLLAPNHFHNAGLATWKSRYPTARIVAHPTALRRLRKKVPGVEIDDLTVLEAALPAGVRVFSPPSAKQGETFVSVATKDGPAWVSCDAIINERRLPGGLAGTAIRLLGFRAGLMTNPVFKRIFVRDKSAYKDFVLGELDREAPRMFVPCHGDPLRGDDVASRLRAITSAA